MGSPIDVKQSRTEGPLYIEWKGFESNIHNHDHNS